MDLFQDKASDWDTQPIPVQISAGVSQAILKRVPLDAHLTVMDFGAGTGLICEQIAPHVKRIIAVDISEAMLNQLKDKPALQRKVEIHCQDITETPLEQKVDLIVSAMAMHHVDHTRQLFGAFAEHLSGGGRLALADLDREDGDFHPPHVEGVYHAGFDREELKEIAVETGFFDVCFNTATEVNKEGKIYPIFLMTATKA